MSSSKYPLLRVALCLHILLLVADCNGNDEMPSEKARKYCGPALNKAISSVCGGLTVSRVPIANAKRSGKSEYFDIKPNYPYLVTLIIPGLGTDETGDYITDGTLSFPRSYDRLAYQLYPFLKEFVSASPTHARSDWLSMAKRGIVEECCKRPCTQSEIVLYCLTTQ